MALSKDLCGILAVGGQKERAARDFYLEAAGRITHPLGKQMFHRLAKEEIKHAQMLQDWANWLKAQIPNVRAIYAYFNNDVSGHALNNARTLRRIMGVS